MAIPVGLIGPIVSAVSGIGGMLMGAGQERKAREEMEAQRRRERADAEAVYNHDYYGDYTKRADARNAYRRMQEMLERESRRDRNTAVVTGATPEEMSRRKEGRNRAIANFFGNIGAQGEAFKGAAKNRYLRTKAGIDRRDYEARAERARSAHNLMYNGLGMLGKSAMDWAGVLGGGGGSMGAKPTLPKPTPLSGGVRPIGVKGMGVPTFNESLLKKL